ncbi:STAS domain-containing protein [Clostridiaceae bacterium HSG29]|nr:STAS domain-containing protein [Clostridiaceae bacterium HSG29]
MKDLNEIVKSKIDEEVQIISINGRLTYDEIANYKEKIKAIIDNAEGYIIDLTKVEQIDSTGLGLIINTAKHFISNQNKMVIVNNNPLTNELFKISKLHMVFNICETINDAMKIVLLEDEEYINGVKSY